MQIRICLLRLVVGMGLGCTMLPLAMAQQAPPVAAPEVPDQVPSKTELGELNGASFRIDIPEKWNGELILMSRGYTAKRTEFTPGKLRYGWYVTLINEGFALAQSGYSSGGWAIEEAVTDNESLLRYFILKNGKPKAVYALGVAMGGYVTATMLERSPHLYDAGWSFCSPLGSYNNGNFDLRVLFDYYYPGAMPAIEDTPKDYVFGPEATQKALVILQRDPAKAEILRRFGGLKTIDDLARRLALVFFTLKEMQTRAGGNPFDNRGVNYVVDDDMQAVNAGVKRYTPDARALTYLRTWDMPTGKLQKPLLAIRPIYDPIVGKETYASYRLLTYQAGSGELFVQQYVNDEGHCRASPEALLQSFKQLRAWSKGGPKPPFGLVK